MSLALAMLAVTLVVVGPGPSAGADEPVKLLELFEGDASSEDWENTYILSLLSHYAYEGTLPGTGDYEDRFDEAMIDAGAVSTEPLLGSLSDTQGAIVETDDAIIVTLRGTEFDECLGLELDACIDFIVDAVGVALNDPDGTHLGFKLAAVEVLPQIQAALDARPGKPVWFTGHSLGASVAQVAAYLLRDEYDINGVVTFGQPHTFRTSIAYAFYLAHPLHDVTELWANNGDIVPHLVGATALVVTPLALPYLRVGDSHQIQVHDGDCSIVDTEPLFGFSFEDHDTKHYSTRILNEMPFANRDLLLSAEVPSALDNPPLPADRADCDGAPGDVVPVVTGTAGDGGWYTSDVTVGWSLGGAFPSAPVLPICAETELTADTAGTTVSCTVELVNGSSFTRSIDIKIDQTPPSAQIAADRPPNGEGWYDAPVFFNFSGSDATSGVAGCTGTISYSEPDSSSASRSGTCTDNAGNVSAPATASFGYDETAPSATASLSRAADSNGWYNAPVGVSWSGTDATSGIASCSAPETYSGPDSLGATLTGSCTDKAGNTSADASAAVAFDATAPSAAVSLSRAADSNGWYNAPVGVSWSGSDATSGVASCAAAVTYSGPDTDTATRTGTCTDEAGNTSASASTTFAYDATAPLIDLTTPPDGVSYLKGQTVAAAYGCSDATSGLVGCAGPVPSGSPVATGSFGSFAFEVVATDLAGNQSSRSHAYSIEFGLADDAFVDPYEPAPAVNTAKAGSRVPLRWMLETADGTPVVDDVDRFSVHWSDIVSCSSPTPLSDVGLDGEVDVRWAAGSQQYIAGARSDKSWGGTCRYLVLDIEPGGRAGIIVEFV